jgi:hypothetical protein
VGEHLHVEAAVPVGDRSDVELPGVRERGDDEPPRNTNVGVVILRSASWPTGGTADDSSFGVR